MSVPPLTAESTERLGRAVEVADAMVDEGVPAAAALAKAARDEAVPHVHVPMLARAFNTGRAVRQLGAADVWAKAADHPVATPEDVYAELSRLDDPAGEAGPATKAAAYARPPAAAPVALPAPVLPPLPAWALPAGSVKAAAAPAYRDTRTALHAEAADLVDRLRDAVAGVSPATYAGVKAAARHALGDAPEASTGLDGLFAHLEAGHPFLAAKGRAAAAPDPLVSTAHPAVGLVVKLAAVRARHPAAPQFDLPAGAVTLAAEPHRLWYRAGPPPAGDGSVVVGPPAEPALKAAAATLDVVDPEAFRAAKAGGLGGLGGAAGALEAAAPGGLSGRIGQWRRGVDSFYQPDKDGAKPGTAVGRGFWPALAGSVDVLTKSPMTGAVANSFGTDPGPGRAATADRAAGKLETDLGRIDDQAALQEVVTDKRLSGADPKTVIETYRSLARLAPEAMKNPAIAADFIHRTIHTGPPSLFDLNQLVTLEKNIAQIGRYRAGQDAEEDDRA